MDIAAGKKRETGQSLEDEVAADPRVKTEKWRIPIVPANSEGGKEKPLEWTSLQRTNAEMQFAQWTEFLKTSIAALFGVDLEELGIRTQTREVEVCRSGGTGGCGGRGC